MVKVLFSCVLCTTESTEYLASRLHLKSWPWSSSRSGWAYAVGGGFGIEFDADDGECDQTGGAVYRNESNNNTYFYIQNIRGDVVMLVNSNGAVSSIRDYDASGQMLSQAPNPDIDRDPFGFTGGLDAGNRLWKKLGARFYDSGKNSFIQQDRYMGDPGDPLSLNRYVYCGMDPVNFVDPSGFNAEALRWGMFVLEGAGVTISMLTGVGEIALGVTLVAAGTYMLVNIPYMMLS